MYYAEWGDKSEYEPVKSFSEGGDIYKDMIVFKIDAHNLLKGDLIIDPRILIK